MKKVLLIRHAKTEQIVFGDDFKRQLTERGHHDCKIMSSRLKEKGFKPDLIKVSPAKRTTQTVENFAKYLDWKKDSIQFVPDFYNAPPGVLFDAIVESDNKINSLVIIGHDPGISELFKSLENSQIDGLPTCGVALFEFDTDQWKKIKLKDAHPVWHSWPSKED